MHYKHGSEVLTLLVAELFNVKVALAKEPVHYQVVFGLWQCHSVASVQRAGLLPSHENGFRPERRLI